MHTPPSSPAAQRNRQPIAAILDEELPATGKILEIASGTGEHALYFAEKFPQILWQPSDASEAAIEAIASWSKSADLPNLLPPLQLDASDPQRWPAVGALTAILCINMVHISPWSVTTGLFTGAQARLQADDPLILYGPYLRSEVETAASNVAFDADLKRRNPAWGLRALEDVDKLAANHQFQRTRLAEMPANNIMLVYRRA